VAAPCIGCLYAGVSEPGRGHGEHQRRSTFTLSYFMIFGHGGVVVPKIMRHGRSRRPSYLRSNRTGRSIRDSDLPQRSVARFPVASLLKASVRPNHSTAAPRAVAADTMVGGERGDPVRIRLATSVRADGHRVFLALASELDRVVSRGRA
jgi:hypothetical protein